MLKWTKRIVLGGALVVGAGVLLMGTGFGSYVRSSGKMLRSAFKESFIPVELEIQRARDSLEDLIPEMQANLRLVAAEEVEVASLEKEIQRERESIKSQGDKVQTLRGTLKTEMACYNVGGREYPRSELIEDMARRFEQLRTAEMFLKGKEELLKNRRRSLDAAIQKLDKTRMARIELASQIESLEAEFRLVQAQSSGSEFRLDETKLARTQKVIGDLRKRLEVAQRVLAREARFVDLIPMETVNESATLQKVDSYFAGKSGSQPAAAAESNLTNTALIIGSK